MLFLASLPGCATRAEGQPSGPDTAPSLFLWAWERPEDLRFLDRDDVGVAFLASTVTLSGDAATVSPRRQPLRINDRTWLFAVVRVESSSRSPASLSSSQRALVVDELRRVSRLPSVRGVQIDFDAKRSQRAGYRLLLEEIRAALPPAMPSSMTALASWCLFDTWMNADSPAVDEVVPLLFTMGHDTDLVWASLDAAGDFRSPACQSAVGVQHGQRMPSFAARRRVYAFSERSWDRDGWYVLMRDLRL